MRAYILSLALPQLFGPWTCHLYFPEPPPSSVTGCSGTGGVGGGRVCASTESLLNAQCPGLQPPVRTAWKGWSQARLLLYVSLLPNPQLLRPHVVSALLSHPDFPAVLSAYSCPEHGAETKYCTLGTWRPAPSSSCRRLSTQCGRTTLTRCQIGFCWLCACSLLRPLKHTRTALRREAAPTTKNHGFYLQQVSS